MRWLSAVEIAAVAGVHERIVRLRAARDGWRCQLEPVTTGPARKVYAAADVPQAWLPAAPEATVDLSAERVAAVSAWKRWLEGSPEPAVDATATFIALWNAEPGQLHISAASLYRWRKAIDEADRDTLTAPLPGTPTEWPAGLWDEFRKEWLRPQKPAIAQSRRNAIRALKLDESKCPSLRTFQRRVDEEIQTAERVFLREGRKAFVDTVAPYVVRDWGMVGANGVWFGDHHQFDFVVAHPEDGRPMRPWLTAWMDGRSRKLVGWVLTAQPNSTTVLAAFIRGVRLHGCPAETYIDNGKDYRNRQLFGGRPKKGELTTFKAGLDETVAKSMAELLEITVHFALPYNAKAKPIERFFGTLAGDFSKDFPTYCGRNPVERPELQPATVRKLHAAGKLPTFADVEEALTDYLENDYHVRPHAGESGMDGRSPAAVFAAELVEKRTVPEHLLAVVAMPAGRPVRVTRGGLVRMDNVQYFANELFAGHVGRDVTLRRDLADTNAVHVYEGQRYLCTARALAKVSPLAAKPAEIEAVLRSQRRAPVETPAAPSSRVDRSRSRRAAGQAVQPSEAPAAAVTRLVQPNIESPDEVRSERAANAELGRVLEMRRPSTAPPEVPDPRALLLAEYQRIKARKEQTR
ncbi:MAG: DDE-type integrase/transposase/recombinase [Myxococcales bacterium]|uniref:Mu transposase C-terminal domain-containing protein n=1 Tax=Sediminibacterium sp. TaxID=1917865 RepID=UPI001DEAE1D7|nr:Mu transposase C-terminal domain-containing protein [Sediminibacterium sp.]MBT9485817.1 DDE-type integrase/transposase/recombinase [Sediminibacterium sp.]MBT9556837.1 DDE-type integrase/transposase/recombinase [Myxococcales bacterium]